MARPGWIERQVSQFLRGPVSVRSAARIIVVVTVVVVVVSGALMRVVDGDDYPNVWLGMWWALQTVTTVGYGDITPTTTAGRVIAAFVMLEGIALLTIVVAAITSVFVARTRIEREGEEDANADVHAEAIHERLDDLHARLDRIEEMLSRQTGP